MDVEDALGEGARRTRRRAAACSRRGRSTRRPRRRAAGDAALLVRGAGRDGRHAARPPRSAGRARAPSRGPAHRRRCSATSAICAGSSPRATAPAASATKLLPRPESRTPSSARSSARAPAFSCQSSLLEAGADRGRRPRRRRPRRTRPMGSARWPAARRRRESSASASGATTATMPIPMLKTRNISSSSTSPFVLQQAEGLGDLPAAEADLRLRGPAGRTRGTLSVRPPPVMWASACRPGLTRAAGAAARGRRGAARAATRRPCACPGSREVRSLQPEAAAARTGSGAPASSRWCAARPRAGRAGRRRRATRAPSSTCGAVDQADDEADQLVVAGLVEARHLRGLAAEQRAAVLAAAVAPRRAPARPSRPARARPRRRSRGRTAARAPCTRMSLTQWFTRSRPTVE